MVNSLENISSNGNRIMIVASLIIVNISALPFIKNALQFFALPMFVQHKKEILCALGPFARQPSELASDCALLHAQCNSFPPACPRAWPWVAGRLACRSFSVGMAFASFARDN